MKRIFAIILSALFVTLCFSSCEKAPTNSPSESQIKAICELTTVEAYYNNLAKSIKKDDIVFGLGEREKEFWLEYEGYAKIGIDMSDLSMNVSENIVTIIMPSATLQEVGLISDSFDENSYICSDGSLKIKAEDLTKAVSVAQNEMKEEVLKNKALFIQAQDKAKILIENYINKLGEMSGIEYEIIWKTIESKPINADTQE